MSVMDATCLVDVPEYQEVGHEFWSICRAAIQHEITEEQMERISSFRAGEPAHSNRPNSTCRPLKPESVEGFLRSLMPAAKELSTICGLVETWLADFDDTTPRPNNSNGPATIRAVLDATVFEYIGKIFVALRFGIREPIVTPAQYILRSAVDSGTGWFASLIADVPRALDLAATVAEMPAHSVSRDLLLWEHIQTAWLYCKDILMCMSEAPCLHKLQLDILAYHGRTMRVVDAIVARVLRTTGHGSDAAQRLQVTVYKAWLLFGWAVVSVPSKKGVPLPSTNIYSPKVIFKWLADLFGKQELIAELDDWEYEAAVEICTNMWIYCDEWSRGARMLGAANQRETPDELTPVILDFCNSALKEAERRRLTLTAAAPELGTEGSCSLFCLLTAAAACALSCGPPAACAMSCGPGDELYAPQAGVDAFCLAAECLMQKNECWHIMGTESLATIFNLATCYVSSLHFHHGGLTPADVLRANEAAIRAYVALPAGSSVTEPFLLTYNPWSEDFINIPASDEDLISAVNLAVTVYKAVLALMDPNLHFPAAAVENVCSFLFPGMSLLVDGELGKCRQTMTELQINKWKFAVQALQDAKKIKEGGWTAANGPPSGSSAYDLARHRKCANLLCKNMSGFSESRLKCRKCSGCRLARYCGEACQRQHWAAEHKRSCKLIQAEEEKRKEQDTAASE